MYTPQINYYQAVKRWCQHVDHYNAQCETITTERKVLLPTGQEVTKTTTRKVGTIKASVKATAMHLIAQYAEVWATANRHHHDMASPHDVFLATNRVEISEKLNRSPRSVYDHIQKLIAVGLVSKYEFCGRQHSFKLWISTKILFGVAPSKTAEMPVGASKKGLSMSVRQKLPPSDISSKKHSTTIRAVECEQTLKQNHGNNEDPRRCAQKGNEPASSLLGSTETRKGGRGAAGRYEELGRSWNRLPVFLKNLTLQFWLLTKTSLYPRNTWSEDENKMATLEIYEGLFGKFAVNQSDAAWADYYNELAERVGMAQQWFRKHADRYPDKPFPSQKKMGYFDPKNNFGFAATAVWLAKDQLRRRENRVEYILNQARIDFENLAAGKPRQKHREKSEIQLFMYYQGIVKTYGVEVQNRFHNQYLEQKARKFVPKKVTKMSIRAHKAAAKAAKVIEVEPWMEMGEWYYSE